MVEATRPRPEPAAKSKLTGPPLLRFDRVERVVHWVNATLFAVVMTTAVMLYIPPISAIVGRRELVVTIHVYAGLLLPFPLLFGIFGRRWGRRLRADLRQLNHWIPEDKAWFRRRGWPPERVKDLKLGKFNAGQKLNAAFTGGAILVMLATGSIMHWFNHFPLSWRTGATFVHDWIFIALFFTISGHILFAFADRDSMNSMLTGTISRNWARRHAPRWLEAEKAAEKGAPAASAAPAVVPTKAAAPAAMNGVDATTAVSPDGAGVGAHPTKAAAPSTTLPSEPVGADEHATPAAMNGVDATSAVSPDGAGAGAHPTKAEAPSTALPSDPAGAETQSVAGPMNGVDAATAVPPGGAGARPAAATTRFASSTAIPHDDPAGAEEQSIAGLMNGVAGKTAVPPDGAGANERSGPAAMNGVAVDATAAAPPDGAGAEEQAAAGGSNEAAGAGRPRDSASPKESPADDPAVAIKAVSAATIAPSDPAGDTEQAGGASTNKEALTITTSDPGDTEQAGGVSTNGDVVTITPPTDQAGE